DGRGAGHLRALEPACLLRRRAPLRRRRRARAGTAIGRHHRGLLLLQRRALRTDASHHDRLELAEARLPRRAGRAVDHEIEDRDASSYPRLAPLGQAKDGLTMAAPAQAIEAHVSSHTIPADPYPWPFDGSLRPENTALIVIDMQTDFCGIGGY